MSENKTSITDRNGCCNFYCTGETFESTNSHILSWDFCDSYEFGFETISRVSCFQVHLLLIKVVPCCVGLFFIIPFYFRHHFNHVESSCKPAKHYAKCYATKITAKFLIFALVVLAMACNCFICSPLVVRAGCKISMLIAPTTSVNEWQLHSAALWMCVTK